MTYLDNLKEERAVAFSKAHMADVFCKKKVLMSISDNMAVGVDTYLEYYKHIYIWNAVLITLSQFLVDSWIFSGFLIY